MQGLSSCMQQRAPPGAPPSQPGPARRDDLASGRTARAQPLATRNCLLRWRRPLRPVLSRLPPICRACDRGKALHHHTLPRACRSFQAPAGPLWMKRPGGANPAAKTSVVTVTRTNTEPRSRHRPRATFQRPPRHDRPLTAEPAAAWRTFFRRYGLLLPPGLQSCVAASACHARGAPCAFVARCGGGATRHSEERSDEESG